MANFYEFFAGGGMARAGLGRKWKCLFANDFDAKKVAAYQANWGGNEIRFEDIARLTCEDLPGISDLAWASFPCQDLSLAGAGAGLKGKRSGTFWPFWRLIKNLAHENRAPALVVLENVCGAITSHDGKDFVAICEALAESNYRFGAIVVDAANFLPHSRPRLFIIAVNNDVKNTAKLLYPGPDPNWHTPQLVQAYDKLSLAARSKFIWWRLPVPPKRIAKFSDLIEEAPRGVSWHTRAETDRLIKMMSPLNREKLKLAMKEGRQIVGAIYKRTRYENGKKTQRAEIRFDDVVGCLRTPLGGSSRQTIMIVNGPSIKSRLISPRETARLMGLPEDYRLPERYNDAYHLTGDGVVVPVVQYITEHLLNPLCASIKTVAKKAA